MRDAFPRYRLTLPDKGLLDPHALFGKTPERLWLEVGFGGGEHLAARAQTNPAYGLIGCEPFINGIAGLLDHMDRHQLQNIRIYPDDARPLLDVLPDQCLDRCFVLFSDPWPKARHADRRFIGPYSLPRLARVLKKDAELLMATDHVQLAQHIRDHLSTAAEFTCERDSPEPPPDWVPTRYEEKGIQAGRKPVYFSYRRV